jgi:hypothetical protein
MFKAAISLQRGFYRTVHLLLSTQVSYARYSLVFRFYVNAPAAELIYCVRRGSASPSSQTALASAPRDVFSELTFHTVSV